jgi:hypothetical protein
MAPKTWYERISGEIEKPVRPKKPRKPKTYTVVCQQWEESERGWGTRPDGYSLHLSEGEREAYVKDFWEAEAERNNPSTEVPDEYSRPCGSPYLVDVSKTIYAQVEATKNGKRFSGPMPKGATSGWVTRT